MKKPATLFYILATIGILLIGYALLLASDRRIAMFLFDTLRRIENIGMGLASFALTLLFFVKKNKITRYSEFLLIKTPDRKRDYFIIANLAWFFLIPAGFVYYYLRVWRGDYAAADIQAALSHGQFLVCWMAVPLNILLALFLIGPETQAILFKGIRLNSFTRFVNELIFIIFILIALFTVLMLLLYGDFLSVLATLVITYVVMSVRARKLTLLEQETE